jgi:hypothetical protein
MSDELDYILENDDLGIEDADDYDDLGADSEDELNGDKDNYADCHGMPDGDDNCCNENYDFTQLEELAYFGSVMKEEHDIDPDDPEDADLISTLKKKMGNVDNPDVVGGDDWDLEGDGDLNDDFLDI